MYADRGNHYLVHIVAKVSLRADQWNAQRVGVRPVIVLEKTSIYFVNLPRIGVGLTFKHKA